MIVSCLCPHLSVRVGSCLAHSLLLLLPKLLNLLPQLIPFLSELPGAKILMRRGRAVAQDITHLVILEHLLNLSVSPLLGEIRIVLQVALPRLPSLHLALLLNLIELIVQLQSLPIRLALDLGTPGVQLILLLRELIQVDLTIGELLLQLLLLLINLLNLFLGLLLDLLLLLLDLLNGILRTLLLACLLGTGLFACSQLLLNHLSDAFSGILLPGSGLTGLFAFRPFRGRSILGSSLLLTGLFASRSGLLLSALLLSRLLFSAGLLLGSFRAGLLLRLLLTAGILPGLLLTGLLLPLTLTLISTRHDLLKTGVINRACVFTYGLNSHISPP